MSIPAKKTLLNSAIASALLLGTAGFSTAQAELEFNVGVFTDYLLWGGSASGNNAVVQGGVDYAHESGFYVGTWMSTLGDGDGQEVDLYAGYSAEFGDFGIDVGYVYYYYPVLKDANYGDIVLAASYGPVYASFNYALNADDSEYEGSRVFAVGGEFEMMPTIYLSGEIGYTKQKAVDNTGARDDTSFTFWQLGVTKSTNYGDISLTYGQNDLKSNDTFFVNSGDPLFIVGYSITF